MHLLETLCFSWDFLLVFQQLVIFVYIVTLFPSALSELIILKTRQNLYFAMKPIKRQGTLHINGKDQISHLKSKEKI